jgi:competence protein ComGF
MKMLLERQKAFVTRRKDNGFTMIEMLFSLVIFMMISLLAVQIFSVMHTNLLKKNQINLKEWEMFSMQMQNEIRNSTDQSVVDNKLYVVVNGSLATIEYYQNMVRRQVEGRGHEIMLQNVSDFQVKQEGTYIVVQVTDAEGHQYNRKFHPYFKKEFKQNE